ncbi:MAG TPA: hypothetical protein PLC54_06835 [Spirochaetales bacterium]|nr:hypothetical protein [Spirochaetales bacterium]
MEQKTQWEASIEAGFSFCDTVFRRADNFGMDCFVALDLLLDRTWSYGLSIPVAMALLVGNEVPTLFGIGLGDLCIAVGWTGRVRDTRLGLSATITTPTGNTGSIPDGLLAVGSGRWFAGLNASASVILDPVVLGMGLSYELGFLRPERFGYTWEPGTIGFGLSVTEILNDSIGYSIRLMQNLGLPTVYAGVAEPDDLSYSAIAFFEFFYSKNNQSLRLGFSKGLGAGAGAGLVSFSYSYTVRSRENLLSGSEE